MGEFVRHPHAIELLPSAEPGPDRIPSNLELIPVGDCVLGLDNHLAGLDNAGVNWIGTPGCTRLELSPRPEPTGDRSPSGALRANSAVPTADGAVVGIGDYSVMRWDDDGIAGTQASDVVRMGQQLFVVGSDVVDGQVNPVVWTSDDGGATLSRLQLPGPPVAAH